MFIKVARQEGLSHQGEATIRAGARHPWLLNTPKAWLCSVTSWASARLCRGGGQDMAMLNYCWFNRMAGLKIVKDRPGFAERLWVARSR
jgi:hypothetical protein